MNVSTIFSKRGKSITAYHAYKTCLATVLVVLAGFSLDIAICRAQQPDDDVPGTEVLTRGPVHEAFAGVVTFNPEPGVVVAKAPPEIIEELPPDEKPEGDNVTWIPGYWAWDDERSDFLWISGTWRALPPGREWMAGYWAKTAQGYQWTSGYWADTTAQETTYLPQPPATVEVGPNIVAPSVDYGWTPGCWVWYQSRYAWRPGYWVQGRADWDWCPSHYVWTPRGYVFIGGFWDYPVERRGLLFAPVYFQVSVYSRRGYSYSPRIVIGLNVFSDHLFLRPRYNHYYFGDYYAPSYVQGGFYASFSFQSSRYGYDPIYSHQRWEHRQDREWEHRIEASYQDRRDHESARPPRTWTAQRNINPGSAESRQSRPMMAAPIDQLAQRKDGPMRLQPVAQAERQKLAQRGQEVQQSRDQRRTLESKSVTPVAGKTSAVIEPVKVQLPKSTIVARPVKQLEKNQAPPRAPQAPKPNLKTQPSSETPGRPPSVNQSNPQPEPRRPQPEKKPAPDLKEPAPRERQPQPESPPPSREPGRKSPEELQQNANGVEKKLQPEPYRRTPDAVVKTLEDSPRNVRAFETKPPLVAAEPIRQKSVPIEKGGARLLKMNAPRKGPDMPVLPEKPPAPPSTPQ